jgi:hypothetical protein
MTPQVPTYPLLILFQGVLGMLNGPRLNEIRPPQTAALVPLTTTYSIVACPRQRCVSPPSIPAIQLSLL